jgi:hypothetical protein
MKAKITLIILALVMLSAQFVLPSPAKAITPESLQIEVDMWLTGIDSAEGTFETNGLFVDSGYVNEEFFIAGNTSHGVKTLEGTAGMITIKYQVDLTWTATSGIASGRFVIISGTGAYESLHGVGVTYAELDLATGHLVASYTGQAHFD